MKLVADFVLDGSPVIAGRAEFELRAGNPSAPSGPVASEGDRSDDIRVTMVMPAVVDASVRFRGYRESLADNPFSSSEHICSLHRRYGVGACKESGNSWEALRHLIDVLDVRNVAVSGPVLVSGEPTHEVERPVDGAGGAERAAASAACEGAQWLMLGSGLLPHHAQQVAAAADGRGLRIAARPGRTDVEHLLAANVDVIHGSASLVPSDGSSWADSSPATLAKRWADIDPDRHAEKIGALFVDHGAVLVPEFVAARRRVLLDEAVDARDLEALVPILPAARHLIEMRRAGGQRIGRTQMSSHGGMPVLKRRERLQAREGLDSLGAFIAALARGGVRLWPGSGAPSVGVVPGAGLWEELEALAATGVDVTQLLWSASSGGAELLGLNGYHGGLHDSGGAVAFGCDPRLSAREAFRNAVPVALGPRIVQRSMPDLVPASLVTTATIDTDPTASDPLEESGVLRAPTG